MEPSDTKFSRSFHFVDKDGSQLLDSTIAPHSLEASTRRRRIKQLSGISRGSASIRSRLGENTLVQSVLFAVGLVDLYDGAVDGSTTTNFSYPSELPERYQGSSVKAKLTWFGALCLEGLGMFVEAYVIITTGQVKTVWHANYPSCWDAENDQQCPNNILCCGLFPNTPATACDMPDNSVCAAGGTYPESVLCTERKLGAVSYAEFGGIMVGMVAFGAIADVIGRKRASGLTASMMIVGLSGMTFFDNKTFSTLFLGFAVFFGLFGLGVGGEYPLTATQAAEHSATRYQEALQDDEEQRHLRLIMEQAKTVRRGETIALVFSMQGIGAVVGSLFIMAFIYFSNQAFSDCGSSTSNSHGVDPNAVESIWRSFYFVGLIFVLMLLTYRFLILEEGEGYNMVVARRERREKQFGKGVMKRRYWQVFRIYAPRLIGTGGCWLVFDVMFYGLKLFSGPIFQDINPGGDLVVQNGYLLLSNACALVGYYVAAAVVDRPEVGRKRLQMVSFAGCTILFFVAAATFSTAATGIIMTLYFLISFVCTAGANVTTYLMAAETYPTELRGTFHGLSAFLGKLGALVATIAFGYLSTEEIFWTCGSCALIGLGLTFVFSADLTRVSLAEHDAQLELIYAGQATLYKGKLNDTKHLSNFELWTGRHGIYDPVWVQKLVSRERVKSTHLFEDIDQDDMADEVEQERPKSTSVR